MPLQKTAFTKTLTMHFVQLVILNGKNNNYKNIKSLTCESGSAENNCLTCSSTNHRTYDSSTNTCDCDDGYYDSGAALCDDNNYSWYSLFFHKI